MSGGLKGFQQGGARIVIHQPEQAPQRQSGAPGIAFFESLEVRGNFGQSLQQEFFFGGGIGARGPLPARAVMFRQEESAAGGLDHPCMGSD
ncbi:MAG TPA: hypothetical protein VMH81_27730 [Bryobacteraceae bacterium]|nr:hypothetical protein [Bryobacteraceae bacterium]